jgi:hypothetical protein
VQADTGAVDRHARALGANAMTVEPPDEGRHPFDRDPFFDEPLFGYRPADDGTAAIPPEPEPAVVEPEPEYVTAPPAYAPTAEPREVVGYVETDYDESVYGEPPPDRTGCAPLVLLLVVLLLLAIILFGIFLLRRQGHGAASSEDPATTAGRFLADIKDRNCDAARDLMTDDLKDRLRGTCDSDELDWVRFDDVTVVDSNSTIARVSFRVESAASSYLMTMRLVKQDDKWLVQELVD